MLDPVYQLNKLGLRPGMSVSGAITKVGLDISESKDPLAAANRIIVQFGSKPVSNAIVADIFAKALIEQAVLLGDLYDAKKAEIVANEKHEKIRRVMPYIFDVTNEQGDIVRKFSPKTKQGGDKKTLALDIFNREQGKSGSDIAKIIASELDITYANAYYYVSRVFKQFTK